MAHRITHLHLTVLLCWLVTWTTPGYSGTIWSQDFSSPGVWAEAKVLAGHGIVEVGPQGTIDQQGESSRSSGWVFAAQKSPNPSVLASSGLIPTSCAVKELAILTLSFDFRVSPNRPFRLQLNSVDAQKQVTGSLETTVHSAAADFFQRFVIELDQMTVKSPGFDPTSPFLEIQVLIPPETSLIIDNVSYAQPSFYVSPTGSDSHDGRSPQSPFASPQKAADVASAGDLILLMEGVYESPSKSEPNIPVLNMKKSGKPDQWITFKNYPGQKPVLSARGQQAVHIKGNSSGGPSEIAYIEFRGLTVRGNGDTAREEFAEELGKFTPHTNSFGIYVMGQNAMVHHIRLANNIIEYCTADGLYIDSIDWGYVEGNTVRNNCWTTTNFAPAGLTVMKHANFDQEDNVYKLLVSRNIVYGNRLYVFNQPWGKAEKKSYFNGNGILIDANAEKPPAVYLGRTLVQNNLVYENGAGGIQQWGNHRVDLINNTVAHNGTNLPWGQIAFERTTDCRVVNNVVVAGTNTPLDRWFSHRLDRESSGISRRYNLYFGGTNAPLDGEELIVADPKFQDAASGRYSLSSESPAIGSGLSEPYVPTCDLFGKERPTNQTVDRGAVQSSSH